MQPVAAIQSEYSFWRGIRSKTACFRRARNSGIGFVPWAPLGDGYLTGKIDAARSSTRKRISAPISRASARKTWQQTCRSSNFCAVATKKNATPAQVALAWLLAQKPWIVPIPGTRNIDHLNENLGGINVELTAEDLREIATEFAKIKVHGERMPEMHMGQIDRSV